MSRRQRDLDSVLTGADRPVQQRGTATHTRYGCPGRASAHALGCPLGPRAGPRRWFASRRPSAAGLSSRLAGFWPYDTTKRPQTLRTNETYNCRSSRLPLARQRRDTLYGSDDHYYQPMIGAGVPVACPLRARWEKYGRAKTVTYGQAYSATELPHNRPQARSRRSSKQTLTTPIREQLGPSENCFYQCTWHSRTVINSRKLITTLGHWFHLPKSVFYPKVISHRCV